MSGVFADIEEVAALTRQVPLRRVFPLALAALLAAALASPAQAEESAEGIDLARQFAARAIEMASGALDTDVTVTAPPGPSNDVSERGRGNPGAPKGPDNGKAKGRDKGNPDPGNGRVTPGKSDDSDRLKGRERATIAIAEALERGNGAGNAFGRGHAAEVIEKLRVGESPATLAQDESHGAKVSAMVTAYNELKSPGGAGPEPSPQPS
jgi:hypothetical protein